MRGIMEVFQAIKERRSIRSFKNKDVSQDKIKKLVEAAIWAPSGSNIHAWRLYAVKCEKKKKIEKFSPGLLSDPPVLLIFCTDKEKSLEKGGKQARDKLSTMDVAIAAQNICLQAESMDLGTCYIGSFDETALNEILDLEEKMEPELMLAVGHPKEIPEAPSRREVEEAVEWMGWNDE